MQYLIDVASGPPGPTMVLRCSLSDGRLEFLHGLRIAYLLALEGACAVGITPKALDVRPSALACPCNPLPGGGQCVLGALTDQACLQLRYGDHLG